MGLDLVFFRVRADVRLPAPVDDAIITVDVSRSEIEQLLTSTPHISKHPDGWYIWQEREGEGLMELRPGDGHLFVGHAKLEPALAVFGHFEARRPGWAMEWNGTLHDPMSLRREFDRRAQIAVEYRRKA
jgi:hypothetical protein